MLEAERDMAVGLVDRAEAIYRSLSESDPRNAFAVVGLARCALERGDDLGAYALAVRALQIDPEDAAALRLEARLSEVLAARGEPVPRPDAAGADAAVPPSSPGPAPAAGAGSTAITAPGAGPAPALPASPPAARPGDTDGPPATPAPRPGAGRGLLRRMLGRR